MSYLGQNFLKDKNILKKIAETVEINDNDFIFEIGAGHGELTEQLINFSKTKKIKILAVEKDKNLFKKLKNKFKNKNLRLINKDVLKIIPKIINFLPINKEVNFKIVGNIPYYITGKILRQISELEKKPKLCVFTLQKEVGQRIISLSPKLNKLSAITHFWSEPQIILNISKKYFYPQPKVDSVLVKLKTKNNAYEISPKNYYKMVNILFKQPRKTILNNLLLTYKDKNKIISILKELNIDPRLRPQNLFLNQIVEIAKKII
ncbi:MAG: 16S rRNA (adenine(1518)-N(6)/adenine(1519)-N(6))-dimethyltransferase RsmA [Patescibacteria group bacterium]|nr:16S rRNA (adenine(1518)-N(6)/adenine(1519)-N(6))-dimethyltransferase RsmA [Patescibacteria group bacterium]MCX7589839.1 16S rRNA (adenine(1518)-N(6)/adenine(1519)-N(6))-dimethyltransferase RsmA [Patescibacteria group bacterium]MDW8279920.1 16S rRNA (adenine(1518)-N(6)/adenine(1519)-N(6))-dimethyltransferase RsmA [bacterium]